MPDSHLRRRSEALQDRSCGWFFTIALSTMPRGKGGDEYNYLPRLDLSFRRDDNSPFFSIVRQLGTQDCITLEKVGEQWRKMDSTIQSTLEINGKDWKQKAQNLPIISIPWLT